MARNYSIAEATNIIIEGNDMEAIQDLGRRYPILLAKIAVMAAKMPAEFGEFMGFMPDYLSANKVNKSIKEQLLNGDDAGDEDDGEDEAPAEEEKPAKKAPAKKVAAKKATKKEEESEDDSEDADYSSMSAVDLFKECKARKIKAAPKKPQKYYIDLLKKDDAKKAKAAEAEADGDDEGWGEEPEEKPAKKAPAKKAAAKKQEEDEDDGEDWDI